MYLIWGLATDPARVDSLQMILMNLVSRRIGLVGRPTAVCCNLHISSNSLVNASSFLDIHARMPVCNSKSGAQFEGS